MKLSKIFWLALGIGVFIIGAVVLYMLYTDEKSEQQELNDRLAVAEATLPGLIDEASALENQIAQLQEALAQARAQLNLAKVEFPSSVESIEYDEILFRFADDSDLEITRLTAASPRDVTMGGITYSATSFTVAVAGEVIDILDFINIIVNDNNFKTATVELINLSVPEPLTEEEKAAIKEEIRAGLPEETIAGLTEAQIEALVEAITADNIKLREQASATTNLVIYSYKGG